MNVPPTIVWFRQDLRLADNPALTSAAKENKPILLVFIWNPDREERWKMGAAGRWWLHHSLANLEKELENLGSRLILRVGDPVNIFQDLIKTTGAQKIVWNDAYDYSSRMEDTHLHRILQKDGVVTQNFRAGLLFNPPDITNQTGKPYQVFTPFWKACLRLGSPDIPFERPQTLRSPKNFPPSIPLKKISLEPTIDWSAGLRKTWNPGEQGAQLRLRACLHLVLPSYEKHRDRPDLPGTSRLSPHLHFGEISARQIWYAVKHSCRQKAPMSLNRGAQSFLRQLGWREFAHYLFHHFPHSSDQPLRKEFQQFPWDLHSKFLKTWQKGNTGYPIVDAGMRELWTTGWMHNRVRLIVASFLVKHLLIPWQEGASWFWDTLVDADLANNTLGWQWATGCGADAAPYFRIFNPMIQGQKFDPNGHYVRQWVPELQHLPSAWIHKPWEASPLLLKESGVQLGKHYPEPIVNHITARKRALAAYHSIRKT